MAALDDPADRVRGDHGADPEHELFTPLTAMRAIAEILRDHPDLDEPQRRMFIERLLIEQARLEHRITQLLMARR